jgi:endo-1,4-beta-xylanase
MKSGLMRNVACASILAAAIAVSVSCNLQTAPVATRQVSPTATTRADTTPGAAMSAKGLKDAYAGKFLIGTAADPGNYSAAEQANITANYNVITPENCMKPQPIHPSEDQYNFTQADTLVKFCQDNNIKVWGHNLNWHSQTPNWFFTGNDKQVVLERLHKHIATVVGRYKDKLLGWDVVNEAINDGGGARGGGEATENLRTTNSWNRICGPEYLTLAFKWAHEADPKSELYYNDYNIESGAKHQSSLTLLKRLIRDDTHIYGVGIQGHWDMRTNIDTVEKAILDYQALGLKVSITELDITQTGTNSGAMGFQGGPTTGPATGSDSPAVRQGEKYRQLFAMLLKHTDCIERVTLWGTNDRRSWKASGLPLLFDAQLQPKPAYQAILDVARQPAVLPTVR